MKINSDLDITQILTLFGFIASLIVWGMRLERQVGENSTSVEAFEKVQEVRWEENSRRLESMRRDIISLQERLHAKENSSKISP